MAMAIPKRIGEIAIVPTVATDRSNALLKNWLYHRERLFLTEMTLQLDTCLHVPRGMIHL